MQTRRNKGDVLLTIIFTTVPKGLMIFLTDEKEEEILMQTKRNRGIACSPSYSQGGLVKCWSPSMPVISVG